MAHTKTKVFIAGKFPSGKHATQQAIANATNQFVKLSDVLSKDHRVSHPTIMFEPKATWAESIRSDITKLMACDELHMLHNWQGHKRSEILRNLAMVIGIKVIYH